ncbi:vacuolar-sorting protein SNF7, putative [Plasmodium knowlesi strain H]|uniref:Vacuolar-sorting protein SNF7, putative n=3 Tax=Plasmodium knowlesi TaxID=5850 RepID=A0A5K1VTR8_PLAKH|nr:vacuolar protein sorting-associated protein 60, putative [Plasmodium knowlesi strain H]OTN65652.1 putative SNF7 family protein [Plasmodium knowlesi]CAA9989732.1 vacuolar protein sorting-associated protein 60, putative [Plasmodium knowlesi strain H]SBO22886.1 vacuolar-sorting protein SNF7, putative [Plasmodium knowlesi strain H]SBO23015.1 vacuolar-sorting protein SNF7, putative [Plasmodium knowlesi strain H]VVS79206.1 vacuolar protein sorting-associated protein 60, putative [Plasmodium knowl|eukprot:XP_002260455.1 SNF7 family protein, putative [Plasmodium knowlesi strain H]
MKFFRPKKEHTLDEAYGNLEKSVKSIDDNIDKYNKELNIIKQKIEEEKKKNPVNQHAINNLRNKAAIIIKRKKTYESNKENTLGIQFNIDQIKYANDNVQMSIDTCKALESTSKIMKKNMKKVNIGKIEKLQDDLFDYMEEAKEIGEILSSSYDIPLELDENEIDAELSLIEDSILDEQVEDNITDYLESDKVEEKQEEAPEQEITATEKNTEVVKNKAKQSENYYTQKES